MNGLLRSLGYEILFRPACIAAQSKTPRNRTVPPAELKLAAPESVKATYKDRSKFIRWQKSKQG